MHPTISEQKSNTTYNYAKYLLFISATPAIRIKVCCTGIKIIFLSKRTYNINNDPNSKKKCRLIKFKKKQADYE